MDPSVFAPRYAGFWLRAVAWLVDAAILSFAGWIASGLLGMSVMTASPERLFLAYQLPGLVWMLGGWLYYAGLEASTLQATPGKMVLGLAVTDMAGDPPRFAQTSIRYWCKILSALFVMIGFVMIAFTARKQALHDIMAGCLVVKR